MGGKNEWFLLLDEYGKMGYFDAIGSGRNKYGKGKLLDQGRDNLQVLNAMNGGRVHVLYFSSGLRASSGVRLLINRSR